MIEFMSKKKIFSHLYYVFNSIDLWIKNCKYILWNGYQLVYSKSIRLYELLDKYWTFWRGDSKKIFLKEFTNIYMINTLTCILLGITSLYITYLFSDYIEIRENKKLFIVPSLFITSQLFVFQYYFVLQNFEFSLAMLLTVIVASYCLKVRTFSGLKK